MASSATAQRRTAKYGIGVGLVALLTLAACGGGEGGNGSGGAQAKGGRAGTPGQGTPEVGYVVLQPTSVPITVALSGRTTAYESSEVRPQVSGIVRRRLFTEGSLVRAGQTLYEIDPRLYRAASNEAQANLASAQANAQAQKVLVDRYKPLADMEAISKQDYTNAIATSRQATASVAQTRAALDTARINLNFTKVPAPISGRIGRSLFTVGALVSASQTDPLTTIQRLDPMFVDIQQSSADLLSLRRSLSSNGIIATRAEVRLTLEDGSDYGMTGSVEFAEAMVNTATGTVTLRARFPNPQGVLLPGMFVRAGFAQAINTRAFLVPQQSVTRDPRGNATIFVVGPNNKAVQKTIKADRAIGANWVVTGGLNAGDKVITQGISKIIPNQSIKPVPAAQVQKIVPPQQGKQGSGGGSGSQQKGG